MLIPMSCIINPGYTADTLTGLPGFCDGLAASVRDLLETHKELPREVYYVSDLRRWLLSQLTATMHFEHRNDPAQPPISPGNLVKALAGTGIASRNTIHGFLLEMRRYRFIVPLASTDRRQHHAEATAMSEQLIRRYFDIHLKALDIMDNGSRHALSCRHPHLLAQAHPRFVRLIFTRPDWYHPPKAISKFVCSDSGTSILHDLVSGAPASITSHQSPLWIGKVSPKALSQRYSISKTHVARLLAEARAAGLIGFNSATNRSNCWIAPDLVAIYRYWQGTKLAAVSQAFHEACSTLEA